MHISYKETGNPQGESILFIHGAGLPGWFWKKQVEYLSNDYHCIVVDLPDHGKSSSIKFTTIQDISTELLELIKKIGHNEKAIVVGHSLGAKIATFMIAQNTNLVEKAVIASALFQKSKLLDIMNNKALIRFSLNLVKKYPSLLKLQAKSFHFNDEQMENEFIEEFKSINEEAMERYMQAYSVKMEIPVGLSNVNIPVLIIVGSKEPGSMKKSAMKLHDILENSKCIILKKCNHIYPIIESQLFNSILHNWIKNELEPNTRIKYITK